jgi:hypothetical protein
MVYKIAILAGILLFLAGIIFVLIHGKDDNGLFLKLGYIFGGIGFAIIAFSQVELLLPSTSRDTYKSDHSKPSDKHIRPARGSLLFAHP